MPGARKKEAVKESEAAQVLSGVFMFPNGDKYDGEYIQVDGGIQRSGTGSHVTSDGVSYRGQWKDDRMNGAGILSFPSGACYEGEFVDNTYQGSGSYVFANGSKYQGSFNSNRLEGEGEFTDTDNQQWVGTFRYRAAPGLRFKLKL